MKVSLAAVLATTAWHWPSASNAQIVDAAIDLPASGRSLFDQLTGTASGYDIPYPYEKLVARLRARAGCQRNACVRQVLIPLGRSLQRPAAIGDYFQYPRVVTAFTAEASPTSRSTPLLRDRLFLGYQQNSNVIEVISYNDWAGRFEFQLVTNYRAGSKAQVKYAARTICMSCHQGLSPIFSRPLWQETNANPAIAERIRKYADNLHGVTAQVAIDQPQAIDEATDRANRLARAQAVWQLGCGDNDAARSCRAALLKAALQYRLSGNHAYASDVVVAARNAIAARWPQLWPLGLTLPDNDVPNRIPNLDYADGQQASRAIYIAPAFDALSLRAPREIWREFTFDMQREVIADLASFFTQRDIEQLDRALQSYARKPATHRVVLGCAKLETPQGSQQRVSFECNNPSGAYLAGRAYLNGKRTGSIDVIRMSGNEPSRIDDFSGTANLLLSQRSANSITLSVERDGLTLRDGRGQALTGIELVACSEGALNATPSAARVTRGQQLSGKQRAQRVTECNQSRDVSTAHQAQLTVALNNSFTPVSQAIDALILDTGDDALSALPFRRTALLSALNRFSRRTNGFELIASCCRTTKTLPPAMRQTGDLAAASNQLTRELQTWCSSCHASGERFPPSFLSGGNDEVSAKLKRCAPRIFQRLTMWQLNVSERNKTTMPPAAALANISDEQQLATYRHRFAALADLIAEFGRKNNINIPSTLHAKEGDAYELLPRCDGEPAPQAISAGAIKAHALADNSSEVASR